MVNADMVNAKSRVSNAPFFVKIFAFQADSRTSKTRLNIKQTFELTKIGTNSTAGLHSCPISYQYFSMSYDLLRFNFLERRIRLKLGRYRKAALAWQKAPNPR
jgi:hypothetical protein